MNLNKTIQIDLAARGAAIQLGESAVSGDSGSRSLVFELMEEGTPWTVPEGTRAGLAFRTEHGAMGEYDTMPDGTPAAEIDENRVRLRLMDAMLAKPGMIWMALVLRDENFARLSAFPMMMRVSKGLEDVGELPKQYYLVRNLEEINTIIRQLRERMEQVDTEENLAAAQEARQAAEEAKGYAESIDTEMLMARIEAKGDDVYIEQGKLYLTANGDRIGLGIELPSGTAGLAFDGGYVDEENCLHLTLDGADIAGFDPIPLPETGGGGDSGARMTVAMETAASVTAAETADEVELAFTFASVDAVTQVPTGDGTMQISVGGAVKHTARIEQGRVALNIRPYLTGGANAVTLTVTDAYGGRAVRNISVTLETLGLEWSLGLTEKTGSTLTLHLTATGNYPKTVHLQVDGNDIEVFEVTTSGRRVTKTVPVQVHGGHIVSAYAVMEAAGTVMTSDVLECACAWVVDEIVPAICCADVPESADQFSTVQLIHRVIDPQNNPATVQYLVNGVLFKEALIDQSEQVWSYRLIAAGETTLSILCGNIRHDEVIQVTELAAGVEEVTDSLALKIDPAAMADLPSWEENGYRFALSEGFDLVNGGLQNDADGVRCIRITAGDRLTLNYPLFATDARANGLAAKLIYAVRDSSAKHCTAISCQRDGMGLEIQPNNVYLRGNQTECKLSVCEDEKTELDFNIQPDTGDGIMSLWEQCSTFSYMKYAADESFTFGGTSITFGCDDADVYLYLARFYTRDLTDEERLANYVADGADTDGILDRQSRNDIYDSTGAIDVEKCASRNPDCHHIVISAERMTKGKKDEVKASIRHIYRSGGPEHQWTAQASIYVQGTSSVEHAETAGPNLNIYYPGGITLDDGTLVADGYAMNGRDKSIPVLELCYKKNIASEDHIVNRMSAEWYNRYQPSVRPERVANPLVRDCLDSAMCCVYFRNSGSTAVQVGPDLVPPGATVFFGLGNLVSNKDSVSAFEYHPIVIEVKNNTEPQVLFKSKDLTGDNWGNNYEFRYLDNSVYTEEQAKAEWQKVQNFLCDTDCTAATDAVLSKTVTIGGVSFVRDSVEYRKAKWDAEAPEIFDKKTLTWHHNITLFLLLRDNRAKNMFWSYDPVTKKWGLWFNWDNDTGLCRNNDGYIDIEPGYMDFDTLGTGDVFNGAANVVFNNLRAWDFDELKADYLDRESAGAWDIDALYKYAMESQESICEALWIEDAAHNAISTMQNLGTAAYLERATGRLRLHLKKALTFQKVLVDSYYCSTAATGQSAAFRGYTPAQWSGVAPSGRLSVTAYTNMYINVLAGNTAYQVRAAEGVPVELDISASLNNTEIYFRHAQWMQDLGDLAGLYLGQFEASMLRRVRRLSIGSENADYYNTNFTQASFDNCRKLEYLNLGGLRNAARSFDFRPNLYLKELYTKGSGVTGVTFAKQGRLETAKLNAVRSLAVDTLQKLETFTMPTYDNLNVLSVEDTPALGTQAMAEGAGSLQRVRLIGIDWSCTNADTLMRLSGCAGRDDDGRDVPEPVITGRAHIAALTQEELDHLNGVFPGLEITYDAIVPSYTVRFLVNGEVKNTQRVAHDGTAKDPVRTGVIPTPTKDSDVEYHYSYTGWDKSLQNITADTDINAVFAAQDRYYTVRYWYDAAEERMAQEFSVIAHGSCACTADEPEQEGAYFIGWDAETADVVSDMDLHPVFLVPELPETAVERFEYLYSDDPSDDSAYTLAEFVGILDSGRAKEYFQVGDRIKMVVPENDTFSDEVIILSLLGFNHYRLADGSGAFAGTVFGMVGLMNSDARMNATQSNTGGWPASELRARVSGAYFAALPLHWQKLIRPVEVLCSVGDNRPDVESCVDRLFLLSEAEVGSNTGVAPYKNEIDPDAESVTLPAFTGIASRVRAYFNGEGTTNFWWLRSTTMANGSFSLVADYGGTGNSIPQYPKGICLVFCMGGAAV
ncbi:MAG: hypothetical protein IKD27_09210 [Oscillospiraceae bacterium]|nr:hypothetical protein [Oscillospiraceae bacterium]